MEIFNFEGTTIQVDSRTPRNSTWNNKNTSWFQRTARKHSTVKICKIENDESNCHHHMLMTKCRRGFISRSTFTQITKFKVGPTYLRNGREFESSLAPENQFEQKPTVSRELRNLKWPVPIGWSPEKQEPEEFWEIQKCKWTRGVDNEIPSEAREN